MENSLKMNNVNAKLDAFTLKDIDLEMPRGMILGLVGRNGAGKTTLIKTIMGARFVTEGEILVDGLSYRDDERTIRERMATVYDVCNMNPRTKGKSLLRAYRKTHPRFNETVFTGMQEAFNLDLRKPVMKLSLGMQKKLMLAFAFAVEPSFLMLDEPTIGIDPIDKAKVYEMIQQYMEDEHNTLIFSSHQIEDVERIADYICFIDDGRVLLFEDKETLKSMYAFSRLDRDDARARHLSAPKRRALSVEGIIRKEQAQALGLPSQAATLEQIFIHLCGAGDLR